MKKQFLIFAAMAATVLVSCSKEKIETSPVSQPEEIVTARPVLTPTTQDLNRGLLGLYEFNGNLVEKTGKLLTGSPNGTVFYTNDRKGIRGRAVKFDGNYNISLGYIPHSSKMSVAAWVKYDSANAPLSSFVSTYSDGPKFMQDGNQFLGYNSVYAAPSVLSGAIDDAWHFLVVTIDGVNLKFYIDGNLIGTIPSANDDNSTTAIYMLGYGNNVNENWHGAIDDLRFYSRALSASEVNSLFNL